MKAIQAGLPDFPAVHQIRMTDTLAWIERHPCDYIFLDLDAIDGEGPVERETSIFNEAFLALWKRRPSLRIIVLTSPDRIRDVAKAIGAGAVGYLKYPIIPEEVRLVVRSVDEDIILESELDYLREQFWETDVKDTVRTECESMKTAFNHIRSVAPTRTTVLLTGETGTGKSLLAKLIHRHSNRRDAQFISVHCGAIPDTLIESELFGHEKGAFTGADRRKLGKFEIANGGSIFLDEVGTLTASAQVKLLMVLQEGLYERVGGEATLKTDVRVIAATNADLKAMCDEGSFRKDLYYRLNVFPIRLPALRERVRDIPHLIRNFLGKLNNFNQKDIQDVHPLVLDALMRYDWPGNIRELENLIERAYILESSHILTPESFPSELFDDESYIAAEVPAGSALTLAQTRNQGIEEIERRYIKELLAKKAGRINASAEEAGVTTRQLHKLMKKYGIRKEEYKRPGAPSGAAG
ncbi:MAG: sigma 54-interacting transcriptional regulator [Desulfobacterales bacterium]